MAEVPDRELQRGTARHIPRKKKESSEVKTHSVCSFLFFCFFLVAEGKNCTPFSSGIYFQILCPLQSFL